MFLKICSNPNFMFINIISGPTSKNDHEPPLGFHKLRANKYSSNSSYTKSWLYTPLAAEMTYRNTVKL